MTEGKIIIIIIIMSGKRSMYVRVNYIEKKIKENEQVNHSGVR